MTIASLIVDVAANTAKLTTDVEKIQGTLSGITSVASKMAGSLGIAFSVDAVLSYANAAFDAASHVVDLAGKTGLTTRAIQEMSFVADQTGASLDDFTTASFNLGRNLAGDDKSVATAVGKLGLAYENLKAMQPDQQFELVVAALNHMENPQERNRLAVELFGKAAKDILPAIAEGYANIADQATISGDKQLQAIDAAGDAWSRFKKNAQAAFIAVAGGAVRAYEQMGTGVDGLTEKEKQQYVFLMKSGGDFKSYLDEIIQKHINLQVEQAGVALQTKNQAQAYGALKTMDIPKDIGVFELQYKNLEQTLTKTVSQQNQMNAAAERFAASVHRLDTANVFEQFKATVHESNQELQELDATIPKIAQTFTVFKAPVLESTSAIHYWGDAWTDVMAKLPGTIMAAIQGGGSIFQAAGSTIGVGMMKGFSDKYGKLITDALPFGIGNAVMALLPTLGALFGPVAEKIAGFFKSIFGGPSADELRGRQAVADFETQLHSLLTETQRLEAGNESWKQTVIAIRDAYIAQGLSESDALAAAEKLWASSKNGGAAAQAVIDEIRRIMEGGANAAGQFASNLDYATRPRVIKIGYDVDEMPDTGESSHAMGFATGSAGVRNFGSGTRVILHGEERVQTKTQMEAEQGHRDGGALDRIERMLRDQPRALALAMSDALVQLGVR